MHESVTAGSSWGVLILCTLLLLIGRLPDASAQELLDLSEEEWALYAKFSMRSSMDSVANMNRSSILQAHGGNDEVLAWDKTEKKYRKEVERLQVAVSKSTNNYLETNSLFKALVWLAAVYDARGEYDHADSYYDRAMAYSHKVNIHSCFEIAPHLSARGDMHYGANRLARAANIYEYAVVVEELCRDTDWIARQLFRRAAKFLKKKERQHAEVLYKRALDFAKREHGNTNKLTSLAKVAYEELGYEKALPVFRWIVNSPASEASERRRVLASIVDAAADSYFQRRKYQLAAPLYEQALRVWRPLLGRESPQLAQKLYRLASCYIKMANRGRNNSERARQLYQRAFTIWQNSAHEPEPTLADKLDEMAAANAELGDYESAEPLWKRAAKIRKRAAAKESDGGMASSPAIAHQADGVTKQLSISLQIYADILGVGNSSLAVASPNSLSSLSLEFGPLSYSYALFGLKIASAAKQLEITRAIWRFVGGDYSVAEPLLEDLLQDTDRQGGDKHLSAALAGMLAALNHNLGRGERAERYLARAIAITQNSPMQPPTETVFGQQVVNPASQSERFILMAAIVNAYLMIPAAKLPASLWKFITSDIDQASDRQREDFLGKLQGSLYIATMSGQSLRYADLHRRILSIADAIRGKDHPKMVKHFLSSGSALLRLYGNNEIAIQMLEESLVRARKLQHIDSTVMTKIFIFLAEAHRNQQRYEHAAEFYRQALHNAEQHDDKTHLEIAHRSSELADVYLTLGRYTEAEELHQRALTIRKSTLGRENILLSTTLRGLARIHEYRGQFSKALNLYNNAMSLREPLTGQNRLFLTSSMTDVARLNWAQGKLKSAEALLIRQADLCEYVRRLLLTDGSEAQRQERISLLRGCAYRLVDFHIRTKRGSAARGAMNAVLRHKGREIDAAAIDFNMTRSAHSERELVLIRELSRLQAQLGSYVANLPATQQPNIQHDIQREILQSNINLLQSVLGVSFGKALGSHRPVTVEQVQAKLLEGHALVELVIYETRGPDTLTPQRRSPQAPRYAAYVLRGKGPPKAVDLGPVSEINAAISQFRNSIWRNLSTTNADAKSVFDKVMAPVLPLLGNDRHVFIAPEGTLQLVPFAALVDETDSYLAQRYQFTLLNSGRDLLNMGDKARPPASPTVIVAAPAFDAQTHESPDTATSHIGVIVGGGQVQGITVGRQFKALAGTVLEAEAVKRLFPNAKLLINDAATETALLETRGPRILHVATHGFFLADRAAAKRSQVPVGRNRSALLGIRSVADPWLLSVMGMSWELQPKADYESPMARSGLALAGANAQTKGIRDGILTALEISSMNLNGTQLVVLSACDTGIGQVQVGEGIYGLRRALALAGAETQMTSLWRVNDEKTAELMRGYYQYLSAGLGRSEALRKIQLDFLQAPDNRKHPHYWAAFVVMGDPSPLRNDPVIVRQDGEIARTIGSLRLSLE